MRQVGVNCRTEPTPVGQDVLEGQVLDEDVQHTHEPLRFVGVEHTPFGVVGTAWGAKFVNNAQKTGLRFSKVCDGKKGRHRLLCVCPHSELDVRLHHKTKQAQNINKLFVLEIHSYRSCVALLQKRATEPKPEPSPSCSFFFLFFDEPASYRAQL